MSTCFVISDPTISIEENERKRDRVKVCEREHEKEIFLSVELIISILHAYVEYRSVVFNSYFNDCEWENRTNSI